MWQPPPSHLLTPHQQDGGGNWKEKSEGKHLMGRDKDSLVSEAVTTQSRRSMPGQTLSKGYFEEQPHSPSVIADHDVIWCGVSIWLVGVSYPGFVPFQPLAAPSLLPARAEGEIEKALTLCKHCSAIATMLGCYQSCFGHQGKAQHHRGY